MRAFALVVVISGCGVNAPEPEPAPAVTIEVADPDATTVEEPVEPAANPEVATAPRTTPTEDNLAAARLHYMSGAKAYDNGDYVAAQRHFELPYDLSDKPLLLFNLVKTAERSGDRAAACDYYRALRERATNDPKLTRVADELNMKCPQP